MTDCEYCHKEVKKDDDFVLVGKFPSYWKKSNTRLFKLWGPMSPEDFGTIYHKACFLEMMKNEGANQ
jgi:hypothetical protein